MSADDPKPGGQGREPTPGGQGGEPAPGGQGPSPGGQGAAAPGAAQSQATPRDDAPARAAAASALAPEARRSPGFLTRLGLAIVQPRWALALAADRNHVGRSGSDLIAAIGVLMLAIQLRGLATAAWLGAAVAPGLGVRAAVRVLTGALTMDLGLLVLGALALFALAGKKRNLGRAFDLACVAALPLVFVDLGATVVVRAIGVTAVPSPIMWLLTGLSYGWMGALIALATRPARIAPARVPAPPPEAVAPARKVGWLIAAVAVVGIAVQAAWVARNLELVKPMKTGERAPAIAVARVGADGALGDHVALEASRGKVTVLDFWATWCGPCLASMPKLDQLARSHPDVTVLAINLDDPVAARRLFASRGWAMTLVYDDGHTDERYGVSSIPHTVIVDRDGVIREVVRGTGDLAQAVEAIRAAP
jgi:thiol-disulfide isomerase/thioredoxin